MKRCTLRLVGIFMMFNLVSVAHAKPWKGIVPLHSKRREVEKLLGHPVIGGQGEYDLKDEHVSVVYSRGLCLAGWPYGWNVPADTVTSIRIAPKASLSLSALGIDVSEFKKEKESDMPGHVVYIDPQNGISIEFNEAEGKVQAVNYFPVGSEQRFSCPGVATLARNVEETTKFKVLSYSPNDVEEERSSLDHLAEVLSKLDRTWKGYVLAYAGPEAKRGKAPNIASRARKYLVGEKRISPKRVYAMNGGYRDAAQVDLFIVPSYGPTPVPFPTIDPRDVRIVN